jgi:hypothetical protein
LLRHHVSYLIGPFFGGKQLGFLIVQRVNGVSSINPEPAMTTHLTPTQALLLRAAARRADGRVIPPNSLRGGARVKVLTALLQRGWIEPADRGHLLTDAGYAAIGQQRPAPQDDVQSVDTIGDLQLLEGIPVRPGTKLALLVMALRRPQGATSRQLMVATGWQTHTVRGAISGMLRKKLSLNVVLARNDTGERVYRVV